MAMLDAAARAFLSASTSLILDDVGTTCSVAHETKNPTTKQTTYAAAHVTGKKIYVRPAGRELVMATGAPIGQLVEGFSRELDATSCRTSDLLTLANGAKYIVTGVEAQPATGYIQITMTLPQS